MTRLDTIMEYAGRTPVFDTGSVARLAGDRRYAYLILNRLLKAGRIRRVTKGFYTTREDPSLLVFCLKPAYLGLQDAMSFHGLWEQESNPVILTSRKVRPGTRRLFGSSVIIRRISPRHLFGYEHIRQDDILLPVSDVEKTLIDLVYFKELRKDMAKAFMGRIDREKMDTYLLKYDVRLAGRVLRLLGQDPAKRQRQ
jgi:predicted transcriptional regulator of viral defense system